MMYEEDISKVNEWFDAQMNEVNPKQYMQQSPNGADLISRQDAINTLETEERNTDRAEDVSGLTLAKFLIDALPSAETVSKGVLEQFRWERDVAMKQLEEYGIPFCTNKDKDMVKVVRCKNCRWYQKGENEVDSWKWCMVKHCDVGDDEYCSNGCKGGDTE